MGRNYWYSWTMFHKNIFSDIVDFRDSRKAREEKSIRKRKKKTW